jgi:hypothetical protein
VKTHERLVFHAHARPWVWSPRWQPVEDDRLLKVPLSHVDVKPGGRLDLQLSGDLPDDWCLRLANGLSGAGIGLLNGYARRIEARAWLAQLEVERAPGDSRMPDFLGLSMSGTLRRRRRDPVILDFELAESRARGGLLELRVVAHDAVGLLAGVLHRVRAVGLAVEELLLATDGGEATHRLALRRLDFGPPRPIDRRAIAHSLALLVRSG